MTHGMTRWGLAVALLVGLAHAISSPLDTLERLETTNWTFALDQKWSSVVLFTATHVPCRACAPMASELAVAIRTWNASNHGFHHVRFFVVEYTKQSHAVFVAHNLQSVPLLAIHNRDGTGPLVPTSAEPVDLASSEMVIAASTTSTGEDLSASRILRVMHKAGITERRLLPRRSAREQLPLAVAITVFLGVIFAVVAASPSLQRSWIIFHGSVWLAAAVLIHAAAISGVVYDIIRGVPMYGTDARGRPQVINTADRQGQHALEGLLMGGLSLTASLALIAMLRCARREASEPAQTLGGLLALALFLGAYTRYVGMYQAKAGWYSVERTVPPLWGSWLASALSRAGRVLPSSATTLWAALWARLPS